MSFVFDEDAHLRETSAGYGMDSTNGFTLVAYVKRTTGAPESWLTPFSMYGLVDRENVAVYFDSDGTRHLRCQWANDATTTQRRAVSTEVTSNTWYQTIVRSTDGANVEFWFNGTKATSYTDIAGTPPGNFNYPDFGEFNVGAWYATLGTAFDGKVAEVGVWDRVLTSGEITNLIDDSNYKIDDITSDGSLIRYWPLYDSYADFSGNGGDLSELTGSPSADTADHPVDPPISIQPAMNYYMNMMRG
jgi:hypothetical protein